MAGFLIPYLCFAVLAYGMIAVCVGDGGKDEPDSRYLSRIVASLVLALMLYVIFGGCHHKTEDEPEKNEFLGQQEETLWSPN